jgi:LysR family transcriptional regulator AphB
MLDNLKIFICAAEHQSLTDAATRLGMTVATVSRRLRELEKQLGCELFHRSNKGLTLTPAGKSYHQECSGYVHDLELRLENLDQSLNSLSGKLRIAAPTNIGSGPLDEFWQSFVAKYPEILLTIKLNDPTDDAIPQHADIAIGSGPQKNSSLIQKLVGSITPILVASSKRQGSLPESINDLETYPSIAAELFSNWELRAKNQQASIHKTHNHISNDMAVTLNLVKAGAGIALLPKSMIYRELQQGNLVQVMPEWCGIERQIHLVWPYQRTLSIRAKTFRDELTGFLQKQSWFNLP